MLSYVLMEKEEVVYHPKDLAMILGSEQIFAISLTFKQ